jgi:hypothetical protein
VRSRIPQLLAAGAVALAVALVLIHRSPQVQAGPPPAVTELDVAALRDSGRAIVLAQRSIEGVALVEPRVAGGLKRPWPLAAAPDGMTLAVSAVEVGRIGPLTLARADGSQLEVELPGPRGAAFEPGGSWLAVVDLTGALWRVDSLTGAATRLAIGPIAPDVSVLADGRILALRATALLDGSVAITRHRVGGGVEIVGLDPSGEETLVAELDGAARVEVSPDGHRLAFPANGSTWLASADAVGDAVVIGDGSPARFSPEGSFLLVLGANRAGIVDTTGNRIGDTDPVACWVGGGRGCRP